MQKKGVELSMNVIIIAAIALVVLVILVVLVLNQAQKVPGATSCQSPLSCKGSCDTEAGETVVIYEKCADGQVCCKPSSLG